MRIVFLVLVIPVLFASSLATEEAAQDDLSRLGHSQHGEAFDEGPRSKPWKMEGIGVSHFPISSRVPEVQMWFDQGNTLLHNYWYFEAERAFRWCLKLDPGNPMAYWGLARAAQDRQWEFLQEALKQIDRADERERMYIEAWAEAYNPDMPWPERNEKLIEGLEKIIIKYPDDQEAQAILLNHSLRSSSRIHNELLAQQILEKNPLHPGAHHYRIHNWDGPEGAKALDSCAVFGKLAHESGHANHMPGHIYSGIGMWHEAAIWMDSATRVEKAYMQKRLTLPFNAWNYAHNRNYLGYIQEHLGMPSAAMDGGRQLMEAPLDPTHNNPDEGDFNTYRQGLRTLIRALVQFERWDEILTEDSIPWRERPSDKLWKQYMDTLATLYKGDLLKTDEMLRELKGMEEDVKESFDADFYQIHWREIESLLLLERGETVDGLALLTEAAQLELTKRQEFNDPPAYPRMLYSVLGEQYLEFGSPLLAIEAFEMVLEEVTNDGIALSGLARAHHALGNTEEAKRFYGRLLHVWSDAEPGLRWMEDAAALGLKAKPIDESAGKQRSYQSVVLDDLGPERWEPYPAPSLQGFDPDGDEVTLEEFRGRPVLLIFYLGEQCPHCVEQLVAVQKRFPDFEFSDVAVLAVSSDSPDDNAGFLESGDISYTLVSDVDYKSARRFGSFDDFEELELHSTFLIDRKGKIRWSRIGGGPFMDIDFLLDEIERIDDPPKE
ncbi:MAG: redoxin domain-containing protein [Acidobacteriota bacterium]|nr:redoxin domain-containing protein [Acidobacteriota bacterium]MDH3784056.1 redoxin domain-containing protein [Acidobacteriota bacterium]